MEQANLRLAGISDVPTLVALRLRQLEEDGAEQLPSELSLLVYLGKMIESGQLFQVIAESEGEAVGCGGLLVQEFLPSSVNITGKKGCITNMYTHPDFRDSGVTTLVIDALKDEAKARKLPELWLLSTDANRELYVNEHFSNKDNYYVYHIEL